MQIKSNSAKIFNQQNHYQIDKNINIINNVNYNQTNEYGLVLNEDIFQKLIEKSDEFSQKINLDLNSSSLNHDSSKSDNLKNGNNLFLFFMFQILKYIYDFCLYDSF
jgi:hypothetical protein